jgi:hypothetical protein
MTFAHNIDRPFLPKGRHQDDRYRAHFGGNGAIGRPVVAGVWDSDRGAAPQR